MNKTWILVVQIHSDQMLHEELAVTMKSSKNFMDQILAILGQFRIEGYW